MEFMENKMECMGEENVGNGGMYEEWILEFMRNIREYCECIGKIVGNLMEVLRI